MSDDKTIIADAGNITILDQNNRRKRACLVQYSGAKLGKRYPLDEATMIVGRVPPAQILINESTLSRQHARITQSGPLVEIEDLKSSNGTYINDAKSDGRVALKDGDIIRFGTILLKFFSSENLESIVQDRIYRMATIDTGTEIFNKQYLMDGLESEMKYSRAFGRNLSIIYYDLDHFKKVNDTYGHNAGDIILKESARLAKSCVRKDDILGRFGGEEFVVILPSTDSRAATELAERIRTHIAGHAFDLELDGPQGKQKIQHKQTISCGVTQLTPQMTTPEEFLESADKKLYHSKQTGRNKVTV